MKVVALDRVDRVKIVSETVSVLSQGGLIIYPTDTIYGAGVDATNHDAVTKLIEYKAQRDRKPMPIAVSDAAMASDYVILNEQASSLYKSLLPGPYTVISQSKGITDVRLETMHKTLGVRIIDQELVLEIIRAFGKPITTTSALAPFKKKPYAVQDIIDNTSEEQRSLISLIIDSGELPKSEPSTVIDTTIGSVQVLRQGNTEFQTIKVFDSLSVEDTIQIGQEIVSQFKHYIGSKSLIFALTGVMGAGKTHLTKGFAKTLNIDELISSPTYTIISEYGMQNSQKFYHMDLWRIRDEDELIALNFLGLVAEGNVFAVEWADQALNLLEKTMHDAIVIFVQIDVISDFERKIIISTRK